MSDTGLYHHDKLLEKRHLWANIAWDLVQTCVPSAEPADPTRIMATYDLTEEELSRLMTLPGFKPLFQAEYKRVLELGSKAGHQFRAEAILAELSVTLRNKFKEPMAELKDLIKGYEVFSRIAGVDNSKDKETTATVNTQVAVQIVLPEGDNPKFNSLRNVTYESV